MGYGAHAFGKGTMLLAGRRDGKQIFTQDTSIFCGTEGSQCRDRCKYNM